MIAAHFLAPQRLWWLLAVAALVAGYVGVQLWRRKAAVRFTQVDLLDRVAPSRPGWRRHVVAGGMMLGLVAGVVAIARPVTTTTERTRAEGRIILMFDVSLSMEATDVQPSRLEAAKAAARDFVSQVAPDVEVGLISFSGDVNIDVAPTLNRQQLDDGIDSLELAESTAIGDALSTGTRLLVRLAGDAASNGKAPGAIVLLSDGETTVGVPTEEGAGEAKAAKVPVFTIAFGTENGSITDPNTGEVIPVPVKPAPLADAAEATGGAAYTAATDKELDDAYQKIQKSLGATLGQEVEKTNELTWQWAALALVLIAGAWALSMWWLRGMV
jgi:Ca-activated chloride channel family protein